MVIARENESETKSKLQRLEADTLKLKEKIKLKEKADLMDTTQDNINPPEKGWTKVYRKKSALSKPTTLRVKSKYKLITGSSDTEMPHHHPDSPLFHKHS
jgi:hypothetical protein